MLIFHVALLISTLNAVPRVESSSSLKPKRGVVETVRDGRDYKFRQSQPLNPSTRSIRNGNGKPLAYYKDAETASRGPAYGDAFKQPYISLPSSVHPSVAQQSPYLDNLFTMSAGFKVADDEKPVLPVKQVGVPQGNAYLPIQNVARGHGAASISQVPVYQATYPLSKASGSAPAFHNSPYAKKASLPILQAQIQPTYFPNAQSQLVLSPIEPQYSYPARVPKVNSMQLSAPFLSPVSSFRGQVVPISTTGVNRPFPQYKGAAIEVHPTVGGFTGGGYESLHTQPQLHFGNGNSQHVQSVGGHRPAEEIRSDVEIITKKPTPPPPGKDDDEEEDDEGYSSTEKAHGSDTEDDDYESKSEEPFRAPRVEGDFKPSTSFPFKQYDSTFGRYSNRDEDDDEKPRSKYREYSSNDDEEEEEEDAPSSKYQSEDTSKPYYGRQEDDEEEDEHYEKQKTDDSYHKYRPSNKYFDKNFDEDFEKSYRKHFPKQLQRKEAPETEYGSRSSPRTKDYDSEDSTGNGSATKFNYQKVPQGHKDSEGQSSDDLIELTFDKVFGYRTPENISTKKHRK